MAADLRGSLVRHAKRALRGRGVSLRRVRRDVTEADVPLDFEDEAVAIVRRVAPFTMTTPERVYALWQAVRYVVRAGVPGAIAECGVWRGGSMMAAALTLLDLGVHDRDLVLFDTFAGMTEPTSADRRYDGAPAGAILAAQRRVEGRTAWAIASLDDVRANLRSTGYPIGRVRFVPGPVEQTLPAAAPEQLALLRLDTDWYESTRHELETLLPRVSPGGVLIVDDYGFWRGARQAVDEYLERTGRTVLLHRVDAGARLAILT